MARPKKDAGAAGSKTTRKAKADPKPKSTTDLTDEQEALLFHHHTARFKTAKAALDKATSDYRNVCKAAKAEMGSTAVKDIKFAIELETPEGEQKAQEAVQRQLKIAKWLGKPMGTQAEMDFTDRRPATDRAHDEGKVSGRAGETLRNPYAPGLPQYEAYAEGWHEGQRELMTWQKTRDAKSFDEPGEGETTGPAAGEAPAGDVDTGDQPATAVTQH